MDKGRRNFFREDKLRLYKVSLQENILNSVVFLFHLKEHIKQWIEMAF